MRISGLSGEIDNRTEAFNVWRGILARLGKAQLQESCGENGADLPDSV